MADMKSDAGNSSGQVDSYIPDFSTLAATLKFLSQDSSERVVEIPTKFILFLISDLASKMPFDEAYYAINNQDVVRAIEDGTVTSLHEHFIRVGYFEGRLPAPRYVDRDWYLETYVDVAAAYTSGEIGSVQDHYNETGIHEGRSGSALQASERKKWEEAIAETADALKAIATADGLRGRV